MSFTLQLSGIGFTGKYQATLATIIGSERDALKAYRSARPEVPATVFKARLSLVRGYAVLTERNLLA